ncbi:hypothetical protein K0M31_008611 [Melipona bicolor]|uniref:Uncharacterized protein n=1 Tax=Melipona bicolor TaxID=60889 RepID=A0AA40FPG5_9HYME|nr:hypothetical protein K0M31_008611 [Melipona bicolor]
MKKDTLRFVKFGEFVYGCGRINERERFFENRLQVSTFTMWNNRTFTMRNLRSAFSALEVVYA